MKRSMFLLTMFCAALGSGCGLLHPDKECEKPQDYETSQSIARLKVPAGFDAPDTRDALVVPDIATPEAPRTQSGACLDEPPRYRSEVAGETGAQGQKDDKSASAAQAGEPLLAPTSSMRDRGWEWGFDVMYLNSADWSFEGGSTVSTSSDEGVSLTFGYRFYPHLELQGAFDWQNTGYLATIVSGDVPPLPSISLNGDYEAWTPRINFNYNILDRNITPYVTAGLGWSFIDTNVPSGQVSVGCWWDPWYGQICTAYRNTRSFDSLTYQAGIGLRWDFQRGYSLRLGYEKHWYDFSKGTGSADLDEIRFGFMIRR